MKEILRLRLQGHGHRAIAKSCAIGRTTVQDFLHRVEGAGISIAEAVSLSEDLLLLRIGKRGAGYAKWSGEEGYFEHVSRELKRSSVTLALLWEEYREGNAEGYSYSTFCARYGEWKKRRRVWMHQEHKAGDKGYIDYCGDLIDITDRETGEVHRASVFVAVLGASNYTYAEATWRQDTESWIGAQKRAFEYFGGVPRAIIPDNAKSLVKKARWYDPELSLSYAEFAEHYGIAILPARVRRPQDKGKVEVGVQIVQRWILARLRRMQFFTLGEVNGSIFSLLETVNNKVMRGYGASRWTLFVDIERPTLLPLPVNSYEFGLWKRARIGVNYHVEFEKNHYSAPFRLTREEALVKATEMTVTIFHKGEAIAIHRRALGKNKYMTVKEHMPEAHQKMSEWDEPRLMSWAAAVGAETSRQAEALFRCRPYPEQAVRAVMGLLSLSKKYGEDRLEQACARANELGAYSMTAVSNMLKNSCENASCDESRKEALTSSHENVRGSRYYH